MKSLTFTRGAALSGALLLTHAATALAAGASTTTSTSSTAAASTASENTPLNLGGTTTTAHTSVGGGSSIIRTIAGLFIVIAVIYGVTWILRRVKGGKARASGNGLTQLASLPLGNGRSVALVRAGREVMLVGVAEHGVTPIRTYTEAEAIAGGIELPSDEPPGTYDDGPPGRLFEALRRMTVRS